MASARVCKAAGVKWSLEEGAKKSKTALSCAGHGQHDTFYAQMFDFLWTTKHGDSSFQRKSHSNENHFYLYSGKPPFSSSLVYFGEICGGAASPLSCVGHDVKCFLSNLALLLQLHKERERQLIALTLWSPGSSASDWWCHPQCFTTTVTEGLTCLKWRCRNWAHDAWCSALCALLSTQGVKWRKIELIQPNNLRKNSSWI